MSEEVADMDEQEEDLVLPAGYFIVSEASAKISSMTHEDDDGDEGSWRYDDFTLTLQGEDGRCVPKTIELVFKSTDVATFAALLDAAAAFYRARTPRGPDA